MQTWKNIMLVSVLLTGSIAKGALLTQVDNNFFAAESDFGPYHHFSCQDVGIDSAFCSLDVTVVQRFDDYSYEAYIQTTAAAQAGPGSVYVNSTANTNLYFPQSGESTDLSASYTDTWRVFGGHGQGYIQYFFDVPSVVIGSDDPRGGFEFFHNDIPVVYVSSFDSVIGVVRSPRIPIIFGQKFDVKGMATSHVVGDGPGGGYSEVKSDLIGIVVFSEDGRELPRYVTWTDSHAAYAGVRMIPEPATGFLIFGGAIALLLQSLLAGKLPRY